MTDYVKGLFPAAVDNSMRKSLVRCQKMAYWKHERGLDPSAGANVHLSAGRAFAAGLYTARRAYYDDGALAGDALTAGIMVIEDTYDYSGPMPPYCYKTKDRMQAALAFYLDKWPMATDRIKPLRLNDGRLALEMPISFEIPVNHPVTGKLLQYVANLDMLGIDDQRRVWVVDEKTTGKMGDAWALQWSLDSQLTGYCQAAIIELTRQGMGDLQVAGAIIRGIAIHKSDFGGMECLELRQPYEIQRWYNQMVRDMQRWADAHAEGNHDMVLDHACALYNSPCEYARLCKAHDPERLIEGNFVVKHYDPLNRS